MAKRKGGHHKIAKIVLPSAPVFDASSDSEADFDSKPDPSGAHKSSRHTPDPLERGWICPSCDDEYVVKTFESPIPMHLLNSNLPPLASEEHLLRETLSGTDIAGELAKTREAIRSIKATLSALERREAQLQQSLTASKGVFSSVRRLPREIIGEIILYSVGYYSSSMDRVSLDTRVGIWAYSHVCRLWRSEILSRAAIWSSVDINEKDYSADALLKVSVRAKKCGLDLRITLDTDTPSSRQILYSVVDLSPCWVKVQFRICTKLLTCLKRLKKRIPQLQSLDIRHNPSRGGVMSTPFRDCFATAPALRRLTFQGIRNIDDLDLPWSQITHFCDYSEHHTSQLVRRMTQLTHWYQNCFHSDQSKLSLPALQHLRTRAIGGIDRLVTPVLKELHSSESSFKYNKGGERLTDLIRRSSCTITTHVVDLYYSFILRDDDDDSSDDDFEVPPVWISSLLLVCKETPQLTTLYFHDESSAPVSMVNDDLLVPFADTTILPQLRTLIFDGIALETEKACNAICRLVEQRHKESSCLQELQFVLHEPRSSRKDFSHLFNGLGVKILITENAFLSFADDPQFDC